MKAFLTWIGKGINKLILALAVLLIYFYRWVLSPILHTLAGPGMGCRFQPTCSEYALTALQRHGPIRGGWLTTRRLCRCHPWGGSGWDPVPDSASSENHCCEQERPCTKADKQAWFLVSQKSLFHARDASTKDLNHRGRRERHYL